MSKLLQWILLEGKNRNYLFMQIVCYLILLSADIALVEWYKNFYDSIVASDWNIFLNQIGVYFAIIIIQAVSLGLISNFSEMLDVNIKVQLVRFKLKKKYDSYSDSKLEQRLIEDSLLVADKLSGLAPSVIFNVIKVFVFGTMLIVYDSEVQIFNQSIDSGFILILCFMLTCLVQILFANMGKSTITKTEDIKRKGELRFRHDIRTSFNDDKFKELTRRYSNLIIKIRSSSAKKIGAISTLINLSSSLSFIVPFFILFLVHDQSRISIGEMMKISAIYSFLSGSAMQLFNSYSELFKLYAALRRLLHD